MKYVLVVGGLFIGALVLSLLMAFPIMWVWNWLVPATFAGPVLTFWQTAAVLFLTRSLFGSTSSSSK